MKKLVILCLLLAFFFTGCAWLANPANQKIVDDVLAGGNVVAASTMNPIAIAVLGALGTIWGFIRAHNWKKSVKVYTDAFNASKEVVSEDDRSLLIKALKLSAEARNVAAETYKIYKKLEASGVKDRVLESLETIKSGMKKTDAA